MKKAIITGITGQDGAYLAQLLLDKGYKVYGTYRRTSSVNFWRIEELGIAEPPEPDAGRIRPDRPGRPASAWSRSAQPDEIYNLAAQSFVGVSLRPAGHHRADHRARRGATCSRRSAWSTRRSASTRRRPRRCSARCRPSRRTRTRPFYPRSPYGVAKLYAHWMTVNYRESYDIFGCSGILFNHEIAAARPRVRHPQDHRLGRQDQAGQAGRAGAGQPRRQARLGLRQGIRRRHVAHAAGRRARHLRAGDQPHRDRARLRRAWRSRRPASTSTFKGAGRGRDRPSTGNRQDAGARSIRSSTGPPKSTC